MLLLLLLFIINTPGLWTSGTPWRTRNFRYGSFHIFLISTNDNDSVNALGDPVYNNELIILII